MYLPDRLKSEISDTEGHKQNQDRPGVSLLTFQGIVAGVAGKGGQGPTYYVGSISSLA